MEEYLKLAQWLRIEAMEEANKSSCKEARVSAFYRAAYAIEDLVKIIDKKEAI